MISVDDGNSKNTPLVCICIPTYNASATILETLKSILAQSYTNIVIHISDNASTDDTVKVIESVVDIRLNIHRNNVNIGGEGNFTRCIEMATGKYTAIFHADDIYEKNIVEMQVAYLETNSDVGAVFTKAITIDEIGLPIGVVGGVPGGNGSVSRLHFTDLLKTMLFHHNFLVCPSVMVRTDIYANEIKVWGNSLFKSASDVDTWLRLASTRPIAIIEECLMQYRISRAQYSHLNRNRIERADFFLVMDDYLTRPEIRSLLTNNDFRHYGWLERHERVARALNLFAFGRISEASDLLKGLFCWDAIYAAIHSRRGLVTLAGGTLLFTLMALGSPQKGIAFIKYIKKINWK